MDPLHKESMGHQSINDVFKVHESYMGGVGMNDIVI